jgi:ribosome production factor 2
MAPTEQQAKQARAQQLAGKKAPNARVQRYLKTTVSQLKEPTKACLLLKGARCSADMMTVLKEFRSLQAATGVKLLARTNPIVPFNGVAGQQSLEFLMTKNDAALFAMGSHNKKRPNNLVVGRTFDRQLLDMVELGIVYFKSMQDYGGTVFKKRVGSKPLLLFQGDLWQQNSAGGAAAGTNAADLAKIRNLLTDFYRGDVVDKLVVTGIDHVITFTAARTPGTDGVRIHQRTYFLQLKKDSTAANNSNNNTPKALLTPCGPDFDFAVRRTMWADPDLALAARKQPAARGTVQKQKRKNQSTNLFGETLGRLHIPKQRIEHQGGRKSKALRRAERTAAHDEKAAVESELDQERVGIDQEFQRDFGYDAAAVKE